MGDDGKIRVWYYDLPIYNDRKQDFIQVASGIELILKDVKKYHKSVETIHFQCDNAANLSSLALFMYYRRMHETTGIRITRISHNEPHCGKGAPPFPSAAAPSLRCDTLLPQHHKVVPWCCMHCGPVAAHTLT
jgi:hypothetical protein